MTQKSPNTYVVRWISTSLDEDLDLHSFNKDPPGRRSMQDWFCAQITPLAGGDELPKAHYWCRDKDICAARRIYKNQTKRGSAEGRSEATIRPSVRSVRALGASSHNSPPHGSWPLYIARASRAATHSSEPWRWLPEAAGTCRKAAPSAPSGRPAKLCLLRRDQGGVVQSWVARAERRAQEAVDRIGGVRQHAAGAADPHPRRRL